MLYVVSLVFKHREGNSIEASYPPFPDAQYIEDWNQGLPFIAIPDKAHDSEKTSLEFTLPDPTQPSGFIFGIATYLSIESSKLEKFKDDPNITRNHVQKSLCVLSKVRPPTDKILPKLVESLKDNFENLSQILEPLYNEFTETFSQGLSRFAGISYSALIPSLKTSLLSLIKAVMTGSRILFFANHSEDVTKLVYAFASLLPGFLYSDDNYPFKFLDYGKSIYSFSPYVPLQFSDLLNNSEAKSLVMGTCNDLFLIQPIIKYDILVDSRTCPATITGKLPPLKEGEVKFINSLIEGNLEDEMFRSRTRYWFDSLFGAIMRIRNIKEVPYYVWELLDLDVVNSFGKEFVSNMLRNQNVIEIVQKCDFKEFSNLEEQILKKQKKHVFNLEK
ncbi:late secretory pathway protein AVL9 [Histomonas meleagridis]|uniref:late secretory pathway protein AVL9-like n=1 Tax=Histomonas meleagridis TaxID=135588 RepID=UPI00355A315D|nr:late secretory pathway protein AVL9 [Histomonas meleagridis]KAH0805862.1 late secretory pathway protein AVL9-like [Histomonas meleagridis]